MKKILITGISGFVGSYMVWLLRDELKEPIEIHGTIRRRSDLSNLESFYFNTLKLHDCNMNDHLALTHLIRDLKPDYISHLAAQSFVQTSFSNPYETIMTNVMSTVTILEAVREYCPECVVHIAGSSEEYGMVLPHETPIKETNPLRPLSPYGVSKVTQDMLAQQYHKSYKLKTIITRAFNHEGARRGKEFVTTQFAQQVVNVYKRNCDKIAVGNLEAVRDFTHVRDVVSAYWLLMSKHDVYGQPINICSGVGISMRQLLEKFWKFLIDDEDIEKYLTVDITRLRPSDVPLLIGDNTLIKHLGWQLENSMNDIIHDMLDWLL